MDDTAAPTVELELKLQVPPPQVQEVVDAMAGLAGGVRTVHLRAHYLDTADFGLSAAGFAWRLRCEDGQWVQTLKTGDRGTALGRLEHNVRRSSSPDDTPVPDPRLHADTEAGERLLAVTASFDEPIGVRYRTEIDRLVAHQRTPRGGTVELALDRGVITADGRSTEVCELEIELVEGTAADVVDAALQWAVDHGLRPDSMHKARRGRLLAQRITSLPVQRAGTPHVAALIDAIRTNASAVTNRMGGSDHLRAIGADLRRVALLLDGPRRSQIEAAARSVTAAGALGRPSADDCIAALTPPDVVAVMLQLLHLIA